MISSSVAVLGGEALEVVGDVVRSSCVYVPVWVDGVSTGDRRRLLDVVICLIRQIETMMALKCILIGFATDLAKWPIVTRGAIVDCRSLRWTVEASAIIAATAAATAAAISPSIATTT